MDEPDKSVTEIIAKAHDDSANVIYLYIKTHNKTGLKYLGKTNSKNPHKYKGSGKYWKLHCDKHGYDYKTEIIFVSKNADEIKQKGMFYSNLFDIVKSNEWANLKEESGDGGGVKGRLLSEETKNKISTTQKGKPRNQIFNTSGFDAAKKIKKKCHFCNKNYDLGNYSRYHGEKCKKNPNVSKEEMTKRILLAKKAAAASIESRKNAKSKQ